MSDPLSTISNVINAASNPLGTFLGGIFGLLGQGAQGQNYAQNQEMYQRNKANADMQSDYARKNMAQNQALREQLVGNWKNLAYDTAPAIQSAKVDQGPLPGAPGYVAPTATGGSK